jgi:putative salt-induced outer membrane protein
MKFKLLLAVFLIIFSATTGNAEEKEEEKALSGEGEIGLLINTGNTETESVNVKLGLTYEKNHLLGEAALAVKYSSEKTENSDGIEEDTVSDEKYSYAAKIGYKFNEANYVFFNADFEDDRFSGYDYQTTYSIGYGRKLINNDKMKLDIEIGPGYRYDKLEGGETEEDPIFRGEAKFEYKLTDASTFQQDLTVVTGEDNTNIKSVTALKAQIVGALSMKASYTVDNNTDVPDDTEKTDTETSLTLVYDF